MFVRPRIGPCVYDGCGIDPARHTRTAGVVGRQIPASHTSLIPILTPRQFWALIALGVGLAVTGVAATLLLLRAERASQHEDTVRRLLRNSALPLLIQFAVRGIDFAFVLFLYRLLADDKPSLGDY